MALPNNRVPPVHHFSDADECAWPSFPCPLVLVSVSVCILNIPCTAASDWVLFLYFFFFLFQSCYFSIIESQINSLCFSMIGICFMHSWYYMHYTWVELAPPVESYPVNSTCQSFVLLCQVPPCFHSLRFPVWTCSLIFHTVHRNIMLSRYWLQFTHR